MIYVSPLTKRNRPRILFYLVYETHRMIRQRKSNDFKFQTSEIVNIFLFIYLFRKYINEEVIVTNLGKLISTKSSATVTRAECLKVSDNSVKSLCGCHQIYWILFEEMWLTNIFFRVNYFNFEFYYVYLTYNNSRT